MTATPDPSPRLCSSATNCLQWETGGDGSMVLWSSRRPEQRIVLDADEVPEWLRDNLTAGGQGHE